MHQLLTGSGEPQGPVMNKYSVLINNLMAGTWTAILAKI